MILYSRQKSVISVMPVDVYVNIVIRNKIRQICGTSRRPKTIKVPSNIVVHRALILRWCLNSIGLTSHDDIFYNV